MSHITRKHALAVRFDYNFLPCMRQTALLSPVTMISRKNPCPAEVEITVVPDQLPLSEAI